MTLGALEVDRLLPLSDQGNQALARVQANEANQLRVQALGGLEDIAAAVRVPHIHTADLGGHRLAHPAHDYGQGVGQALCRVDFLDNIAEGFEHLYTACFSVCRPRGRASSFIARRYTSRLKAITWLSGYQ